MDDKSSIQVETAGLPKQTIFLGHPQFQHDCESCRWMGRYSKQLNEDGTEKAGEPDVDLYFCPGDGSIVARYGDEPARYTAHLPLIIRSLGAAQLNLNGQRPLWIGYIRARHAGWAK
jgi:hypothetical protein